MMVASTVVLLPLLAIALVARVLRSDLEEAAWRLMAVALLVTPFASLLPKVEVPFAATAAAPRTESGAPAMFLIAYAAVALVLLARLAIAVIAARNLRRDAQPFGDAYLSTSVRVPVTAGLIAPAIFLPHDAATWDAAKLNAVLAHERAHVARRDPLWRFIGRAAAAICWFHPLAWLAAASIERIAEKAADRQAVAATGDPHAYADVLLELVRSMTGTRRRLLAPGMLDALDARIEAILEPPRTRRSPRAARVLLAIVVGGAILTTAMTSAPQPPPRATPRVQQAQRTPEEMHRRRNQIRDAVRQTLRDSLRSFFRGIAG